MLFQVDFKVEYSADMTQSDLFDIWSIETDAALNAKKAGVVIDLWKVVGERKVIAIIDVASMELLDQILIDLPIMQKMGQHVQANVKAIRTYEGFADDIKSRVGR